MFNYQRIVIDGLGSMGILSREQVHQALKIQERTKRRFGQVLMELGLIANENISLSLAPQFGILPETVDPQVISQEAIALVSRELAACHRIIPVKVKDDILTLVSDNLFNFLAADNLKKIIETKLDLDMIFIESKEFEFCFNKLYLHRQAQKPTGPGEPAPPLKTEPLVQEKPSSQFLLQAQALSGKEEAPIAQLVSLLFTEAYQNRASDIHLEPLEDKFRIRYRIDGMLQELPGPPRRLTGALTSRIKIMAGMDIAEKRLPQDGRIKFSAADKELDLRVSTIPAIHGESIVIRILDRSRLVLDLEKLGFSAEDKLRYENLIQLPNGIILVTGPTGCGKTTTLYTSLSQINKPNKKLLTLEDPVEYQLSGINQVQIKPEIGLGFAQGLRSMLRQAPDVIMVGEIRDFETAAIAIQASLTGHLIFSTLHTNDALGAVTRLIDMGIKPYLVASTLQGILAQRLVRSLCPKCKQPYTPTDEQLQAFGKTRDDAKAFKFYSPAGCQECGLRGYRGRIGIFELLVLDDQLRNLIAEEPISAKIKDLSRKKGMRTLREDGWLKAAQGVTTLEEILRATQQ